MANCDISIADYTRDNADLDIIPKYVELMTSSLSGGSIYERVKETLFHAFEDLQVNEKEKAGFILEFMSTFTNEISKTSMVSALSWAKEERDGGAELAKLKADTQASLASYELVKEQICKTRAEQSLICTQALAASAASIRDNGKILDTDPENPCRATALADEGIKYEQAQQVRAATYQTFADAYRKSGVVTIDIDPNDSVKKGLWGDNDGYTWQQQINAERQRIAYEDSKLNHAANSASSMIGQMLATENQVFDQDVDRWRRAVDGLLQKHSSTSIT